MNQRGERYLEHLAELFPAGYVFKPQVLAARVAP
jgi:hypothetical protein